MIEDKGQEQDQAQDQAQEEDDGTSVCLADDDYDLMNKILNDLKQDGRSSLGSITTYENDANYGNNYYVESSQGYRRITLYSNLKFICTSFSGTDEETNFDYSGNKNAILCPNNKQRKFLIRKLEKALKNST